MLETVFEWDEQKSAINKIKHGISFEEACSVFQDPHALIIPDPDHSNDEQTIRIISARKATKTERRYY